MSATLVERHTPLDGPARPVEIIDVDEWVPEPFVPRQPVPGPSGGRQGAPAPRHEVIMLDSEDEDEVQVMQGPSGIAGRRAHRQLSDEPLFRARVRPIVRGEQRNHPPGRRILFSPSPPPMNNQVAPIPPLPAVHNMPPMRRRPPQLGEAPPNVFVPVNDPFPFEEDFLDPAEVYAPARHVRVLPPRPQPQAGPAGNAPALPRPARQGMGLGGAILAYNRRDAPRADIPPPDRPPNNRWLSFDWMPDFQNWGGVPPDPLAHHREDLNEGDDLFDDEDDLPPRLVFGAIGPFRAGRFAELPYPFGYGAPPPGQPRSRFPEYQESFTHPQKPQAGFTNDFAPSDPIVIPDSAGSSSSVTAESSTTLVCARCMEPLVMNAVGPDAAMFKVWGLRCGHLLDGKCVQELMRPLGEPETKADVKDVKMDVDAPATPVKPDKGKGKAKVIETPQTIASPLNPHFEVLRPTSDLPVQGLNSMRSRLRPRNPRPSSSAASAASTGGGATTGSATHADPPLAPSDDGPHEPRTVMEGPAVGIRQRVRGRFAARAGGAPTRGRGVRRGAKGKGKERAPPPPVIQAEHEWMCPVSGCAKKHRSVMIEGQWKPDQREDMGAIPVYV